MNSVKDLQHLEVETSPKRHRRAVHLCLSSCPRKPVAEKIIKRVYFQMTLKKIAQSNVKRFRIKHLYIRHRKMQKIILPKVSTSLFPV